jgi:uncharacterized protein (TIGR02646 family)
MRRLRRPAVSPPTLLGKGASKAAEHVRNRATDPDCSLDFPAHWNEPDVRGALHAMQGWACAYCQRQLEHERGAVDHFRPKRGGQWVEHKGYWWLAYAFSNYLLSCGVCNNDCKGDRFPLAPGAKHVDYASRASLASEARILVDPAEDSVDHWMRVDWMAPAEEGFVKARPSLHKESTEALRTTKTIGFFRLNEDPGLVRSRILAIREAGRAMKQGDHRKVHRLACRYLPFGATVHNFIEDAQPSLLPTQQEELLILLEELENKLRDAHRSWKMFPHSDSCERTVKELLWTFAVLWKDPPPDTLTATEIERWLDGRGLKLKPLIQDKLAKL